MTPTLRHWAGPALLLAWALFSLWTHWDRWSVDLSALYFAGNFFGDGGGEAIYNRVYESAPGLKWLAMRDSLGFEGRIVSPYIYPPWVAGVLQPIVTRIGPQSFFNAGYALNIGALAVSVAVAGRLFRPERMSAFVWVLASVSVLLVTFPASFSIGLNQPQNLVNALTLLSLLCLGNGRSYAAGGLLSVAAAIKLSPAVFVVFFLAERNWRALAGFVLVGLAFVGLNAWISPPGYTAAFLETISQIGREVLISRINHSIETAVFIAVSMANGAEFPQFQGFIWVDGPPWLAPLTEGLLLVTVILAMWLTRDLPPRLRLWLRFEFVAILTVILGPLGWTHYLILPFLGLPAVIHGFPTGRRGGSVAFWALCAAFSTPVFSSRVFLRAPEVLSEFWGLAWIFVWLGILAIIVRRHPGAPGQQNRASPAPQVP